MTHWIEKYTPLRVLPKRIQAADYNRIRLGLLHERLPWHLRLEDFRTMRIILDEHVWVCADEMQNGRPVLAWTAFRTLEREALNTPVECELRLYHIHAGLLMGSVLEALVEGIEEHGKKDRQGRAPVSELKLTRVNLQKPH